MPGSTLAVQRRPSPPSRQEPVDPPQNRPDHPTILPSPPQTSALAGYATLRGVPLATPATLVTGVRILVGGLSVVLGVWADLGALLLAAFLHSTAVLMHGFWRETDPMSEQMEMTQFQKDVALAGAALAPFPTRVRGGPHRGPAPASRRGSGPRVTASARCTPRWASTCAT